MASSPADKDVLVSGAETPAPPEVAAAVEQEAAPVGEAMPSVEKEKAKERGAPCEIRILFDSLDDICLQTIIKHISQYPRRIDWASYLQAEDALMLYTVGGKLSQEARKTFSQISVWSHFPRNTLGEKYPYEARELCLNQQSDSSELFVRVLLEAGNYVSLVALHHLPTAPLSSRMWAGFNSRVEPLRALHLLGSSDANLFGAVLAAVGPRLKCLGARCDKPAFVHAIADHCSSLTELTLYKRHGNLERIWDTVGGNLHFLKFFQDVGDAAELKRIKNSCRRIRKLDVYARWEKRELNPTIASLYASYGAQLLFANLVTMEPWDARRVIDSCPNVECAGSFTEFRTEGLLVREGLQAVGPALKVAIISFGDDRILTSGLDDAASLCRNLRELRMTQLDLSAQRIVSAMFSLVKFHLKVLSISDVKQRSKECLDIIGNNTGALMKFRYSGYMLPLETQMGLRAVVAGNPNLEEVDLKFDGSETVAPGHVYSSTSDEGDPFTDSALRYNQTYEAPPTGLFNPSGSFVDTSPGYSAEDFFSSDRTHVSERRTQRAIDDELMWWEREQLRPQRSIHENNSRNNDSNRAYADHYGHSFYDDRAQDRNNRTSVPSEYDLVDFVSAVKYASNLRQLTIQIPHHLIPEPPEPVESIADVCTSLRSRRVHVCIGGIYYLE